MGRNIGDFSNPDTGEKDWLDVSTVKKINLLPEDVMRLGDARESAVDFKVDNIDVINVITIAAEYSYRDEIIRSEPQKIDEQIFAQELAEQIYQDESVDGSAVVREAKKAAFNDLSLKLVAKGCILDKMRFDGIGFILAKGKKVATIEAISFDVGKDENVQVTLYDCVTSANLSKLIEPSISFYAGGLRIDIAEYAITSVPTSAIKSFQINTKTIAVNVKPDEPVTAPAIVLDRENNESVDNFIRNRTTLLDNCLADDDFDDRFADIL